MRTYSSQCWVGMDQCKEKKSEKREEKERIKVHRVKHPTPSRATDALTGNEEQKGKQKRTKRKKQGAGPQLSYSGPFSHLL